MEKMRFFFFQIFNVSIRVASTFYGCIINHNGIFSFYLIESARSDHLEEPVAVENGKRDRSDEDEERRRSP